MLSWLRTFFAGQTRAPEPHGPTSPVRVDCDDKTITVHQPDAGDVTIAWNDLGAVNVLTTDTGPVEVDLYWVLIDRDGRRGPVVPMGAHGEHDLLKAMQGRLHGFDNMAVVEAMGSTGNASFVVWEHHGRRDGGAN